MVIIAYHAMKSNFAVEKSLLQHFGYLLNYANLEFITTVRTSGCLFSDAYKYSIPFYFRVISSKVGL